MTVLGSPLSAAFSFSSCSAYARSGAMYSFLSLFFALINPRPMLVFLFDCVFVQVVAFELGCVRPRAKPVSVFKLVETLDANPDYHRTIRAHLLVEGGLTAQPTASGGDTFRIGHFRHGETVRVESIPVDSLADVLGHYLPFFTV